MASRCKKFEPNIFNKSKCQSCFKAKDQHSAEALESSKASRKISKYGYLFVAPETFDFGNPLDRSRRWQRRFCVLYDDGELTWSVDENINTVPQGSVDMNKCTDVQEAESLTGHKFSVAVKTPERTVFVKGSAKDETARWRDVLIMYPRSTKTKHRRTTTVPASVIKPPEPPPVNNAPKQTGAKEVSSVTSTNNQARRVDQRRHTSYIARDWQEEEIVKSRESSRERGPDQRDRSRSPGQRNEAVTKRSISTHFSQVDRDQSPSTRHRSRSVSGPRDNAERPPEGRHVQSNADMSKKERPKLKQDVSEKHNPSTYRSIRSMKHKDRAYQEGLRKSSSLTDLSSEKHTDFEENLYRSRSRDNLTEFPQQRDKKTPSYSSADSGFHSDAIAAIPSRSRGDGSSLYDGRASFLYNRKNKNETDEHKMAKSEELAARINKKLQAESPSQSSSRDHYDDLMYMKKGWLLKLDESSQEWLKNWFVLSGITLRYYKDGKAEEASQPEGAIDISACHEASEIEVSRNYGFKLKTNYGDYILSAMTSGIRNNWVSAILKCMETLKEERTLSDIEPMSSLPSTPSRASSRSNSIGPDTKSSLSNGLTAEASWGRPASALSDSSLGSVTSPVPDTQSHAKYSDSGSANSSTSDVRRRLNMDSSRSERSPSPQKRFSCTWPYTSSSSEAGSTTETEQASARTRSNSTGYSQDDIASHAERKARKVSRRANSEYVYRPEVKPAASSVPRNLSSVNKEHVEVKRSVSVPSEAPSLPAQLKDIGDGVFVSYHRNHTGSPRTRRRNTPETDRTKIPAPARAPSAKIKDKSKTKSPRPRSPPPSFKPEPPPNVEQPVNAGREDIIERKWKEVEQHGRTTGETGAASETMAMGGDSVVVDLLETEVESLRGQLENAKVEVDNLQRKNTELRLQMRSVSREHRESVEDLEDDKHLYISQMEDMQDELDHATGFMKHMLAQQESSSVLMINQAKQQLHEAKSHLTEKEKEVTDLKGCLAQNKNTLKTAEVELEQAKKQLEKERHNHGSQESHLKERCQSLQREVDQLNTEVQHKQDCITSLETHIKQLQEELEKKVEEVEAITKELEELVDVRDRAANTASRLAESQALSDLLQEKLRNREDQHRTYQQQVSEMEAEFQQEKVTLEQQLEQLEQRLERAHNHTNLQDGLHRDITQLLREKDDTIAQLEEKLIENDAKIQELTEDLRAEIQESQTLQQNLDQAYDDQALLKRDLDLAKKESQKLESQLIGLRQEVQDLRGKHDQQATVKLRDQLKEVTSSMNSLEADRERMRTIIDQYKVQVETSKEDLESERSARKDAQRRMEELQKQNREVAIKCAALAKEVAAAKDKSKQLEEQLSQHGGLEKDLKDRHKELLEAKQCAAELQEKLAATHKESQQTQELLDQNLGAVAPTSSTEDVFSALQTKHEQVMKEVKRLRAELKKAHNTIDDMEIAAAKYQQQFTAMQNDYQQQLDLMTSRVQDLTSKLTAAEKRVRKLERKVLRSKKKEKESHEGGRSSRKGSEDSIVLDELEAELGASDMNSSASSTDSGTLQVDEVTSSALQAEVRISAAGDMVRSQPGDRLLREKKAGLQLPLSTHSLQNKSQSSQLLEVELKLRNTLNLLQECRSKLSGVIQDLETSGALPIDGIDRASIHVIRERLVEIMKDFDEKVNKDIDLLSEEELAAKERLKFFAEKLSLEAVVVGEMACLLKSSQDEMLSSRESHLNDIQHANTKILELENKVQILQSQGQQQTQIMASARQSSMQLFSAILAEKVILQGRLQLLLERLREEHGDSKASPETESVSSLASKTLAQGELTFVLNKLKERMSDRLNEQERVDIVDQELDVAQQRLIDHEKNMAKVVESYEMDQLEQFATALAQSEVSSFCNINRDNFIGDLTNSVRQKANESANEWSELKGGDDSWEEIMQRCIQQEIENIEMNLQQLFEEKLEDAVEEGLQGRRDVPAQAIHSALAPEMVNRLAEIIGQKAAVSGLVAYMTERLKHQSIDQSSDGQENTRIGSTHNLRRHDSGVILHSSSMSLPTSPVNEEEVEFGSSSQDPDLRMVSHRLALDANTRHELASYLREYLNKECVLSEQTRFQIAQIATDLVNIDAALVKHKKSIREYAEVVTKEAILQAQMTCIINKLQTEHDHQVKLLQNQLDAAQKSVVPNEHVAALEQEVERLSKIISDNNSMLNQDTDVSSEQVHELRRKVEEMETLHVEERKDIEVHYKRQIDHLSSELHEALVQLDEQKSESVKCKNQLQALEEKDESEDEGAQRQIDDLEDELDQAHKDLATLVKLRDENEGSLRRQVSDLEKQQSLLMSTHKKELEQSKSDMQTAMRAVSTSEMNKYEQEVLKLKEKLDEERQRHLNELEKLRKDLSVECGSAAEALLSSKILRLEQQMQNMQADYEQELAVQKAAHRRELARSKDDMLQLLMNAEVQSVQMDKDNIRKRYLKEMDKIKDIYDRSFAAMERSHQKVLMEMRHTHKRELDLLRQEKDQLLAEETHATQAALDAMKKAHEAEVQKERNKFLDLIAKTYSPRDVEALQKQHQEYAEMMQKEMEQLSEQYSLKCLENASLEEQVSVTMSKLTECRRRVTDLMTRNEELEITLKHDVERLNKYVKLDGIPEAGVTPHRKFGEPEGVYDLRVALKVKDVEMCQMKNELSSLRHQLSATTQELEDKLEENEVLQGEKEKSKMEFQRDMFALRSKLEQLEVQKAEQERRAREGKGQKEESPEHSRSPSPKRTKMLEEESDAFAENVSVTLRTSKKSLWRQRMYSLPNVELEGVTAPEYRKDPERSRSSPTISADTLARIAQVAAATENTELNNNTQETENLHGKGRRKTTVGINLSAVQSQEHF